MHIHKSVVINFAAGAWLGLLVVATTPVYLADLGLEGFALVGIWQLLFYIALVFDFGLGAASARELARGTGAGVAASHQRATFLMFERPVIGLALSMFSLMFVAAPWMARSWLDVRGYSSSEVSNVLRLISAAVALQFVTAFHLNVLAGLQQMVTLNAVQTIYNTARYLGGAAVLVWSDGIELFFAFQVVVAAAGLILARWRVVRLLPRSPAGPAERPALREHLSFSGGMFLTAVAAALLSNADRIVLSRMVSAELLGKYTVALTAIGLLQTLVFAFHRAYYPRFAELSATGDPKRLRAVYRDACALVGAVLVPVALVCIAFTPQLYFVWLGHAAEDTVLVSRLLVTGFVLSGVMWLPAAYQQAIGWTRLHVMLMLSALLLGIPLLLYGVQRFGLVGGAALVLLHGLIQVTVGIALMNRTCFPGDTLRWYASVLGRPLLTGLPVLILAIASEPQAMGRLATAGWLSAVCAVLAVTTLLERRWRRRQA